MVRGFEPVALNEVKGLREAIRPRGVSEPVVLSPAKDLREAISPFTFTRFMTGKLLSGAHEYVFGSDFGHTL